MTATSTTHLLNLFAPLGTLAKAGAESHAARSARVAGLLQDGCRRLIDNAAAGVGETTRLVGELGKVRNPADFAALQGEWLSVTQARVAGQVQTVIDLSS